VPRGGLAGAFLQRRLTKRSLELRLGDVRGRQHRRRSQKWSSRHFSEYARILWGVREALPGTEKTIRGFSGAALLIVDEAARVDDALYYAVKPMLAVSGGSLLMLSTPYGRRGVLSRSQSFPTQA
jgi:hypothetical protein